MKMKSFAILALAGWFASSPLVYADSGIADDTSEGFDALQMYADNNTQNLNDMQNNGPMNEPSNGGNNNQNNNDQGGPDMPAGDDDY